MFTMEPVSVEYYVRVPKGRDHFRAVRQAEARGIYVTKRDGHLVALVDPEGSTSLAGTVFDEQPNRRSISAVWGMAKAQAKTAEPQLHTHNILHNVRLRPCDPVLPLAGTVFDPRRYRRP